MWGRAGRGRCLEEAELHWQGNVLSEAAKVPVSGALGLSGVLVLVF